MLVASSARVFNVAEPPPAALGRELPAHADGDDDVSERLLRERSAPFKSP